MPEHVSVRPAGAREDGVAAVDWALLAAIIAVLLLGAYFALFDTVRDRSSRGAGCGPAAQGGPAPACAAPTRSKN
jgi:hypothetical protein